MYEKMVNPVPKNQKVADFYLKLITSNKKSDINFAMLNFAPYEHSIGKLNIDVNKKQEVNEAYIPSTKIFLHYMKNHYFITDKQILKNIKKIEKIPTLILHNRLDLLCPLKGAYDLSKLLKKSTLIINPALGHGCQKNMKNLKKILNDFID